MLFGFTMSKQTGMGQLLSNTEFSQLQKKDGIIWNKCNVLRLEIGFWAIDRANFIYIDHHSEFKNLGRIREPYQLLLILYKFVSR